MSQSKRPATPPNLTHPPHPKTPAQTRSRLHQLMMPEHANMLGTVHGGVIMKLVDEAAAICAMRHAQRQCVTLAVDSMTFRSAVNVGQVVQLDARVNFVGRTSVEVGVHVVAEDPIRGVVTHTNSAYLVFVAVGEDGSPAEVPPLILETEEDRQCFAEGAARQQLRKNRSGNRI